MSGNNGTSVSVMIPLILEGRACILAFVLEGDRMRGVCMRCWCELNFTLGDVTTVYQCIKIYVKHMLKTFTNDVWC